MGRGFHLTQPYARSALSNPNGIATIDGERTRTNHEFLERVRQLAAGMKEIGIGVGDRVSILAFNSDKYLEQYVALWWLGAIPAPLNIRWSEVEMGQALTLAGSETLVVDRAHSAKVGLLREYAPAIRNVIEFDEGSVVGGFSHDQLAENGHMFPDAKLGGSAAACILFTGGTTGESKGALLSHDNLIAAGIGMRAMGCGTSERLLHSAPLFHAGGMQMTVGHSLGGGTHVFIPGFSPEGVLDAIEHHRVTDMLMAPTMLAMLLENPTLPARNLSSLQQVVYGTAPMTRSLLDRAMVAVPGVKFAQGYGMTETGMTVMLPPEYHAPSEQDADDRLGSIGLASPLVEVKICDDEGNSLPSGEIGELAVRGPSVMECYWDRPAQTEETIRDGWLYTGDAGYSDKDGFVYLMDRKKDMIVTGGENVFSIEVENILSQHPAVGAVAVIGIPHPIWTESVHAVIVPAGSDDPQPEELAIFAREFLAGYKIPRTFEFVDALPLSATNKIFKKVLRDRHHHTEER